MELTLTRVYHPQGTNGIITLSGVKICESIELPWRKNATSISCIPEGRYPLKARTSQKYSQHIEIIAVPGRSYILIHPANYALTELRGCIAPVLKATTPGKGVFSRKALDKLMNLCTPVWNENKHVHLIIKS
ncbi:DUF5675 family protein [Paradesertivirga mongoliensis]|uniref:DUF5675 family protein n=1 Tax=Paradesertivirga mongoliensis TaxID=2100740 RepID=A0ABW4ZJM5_9SPHI|nr:DUF5675 family protein [Pedobacter mongoliensis]